MWMFDQNSQMTTLPAQAKTLYTMNFLRTILHKNKNTKCSQYHYKAFVKFKDMLSCVNHHLALPSLYYHV